MIQIAINGNRNDKIIPKTTESIVESAFLTMKKGASSIHFHPRDQNGKETLKAEFIDKQIAELRMKLKNTPIGISTGNWIEPNLKNRLEQIASWKVLPDFVSINYEEQGFEKVAELINNKGIKIEVGLSNSESAKNFINNNLKSDCVRIFIEPQEQNLELGLGTIGEIEKIIKYLEIDIPILLHGIDKTCWDLLKIGFEKNYQTRIGFEDTLILPNGEMAKTNKELIEQAQRIKVSCQH